MPASDAPHEAGGGVVPAGAVTRRAILGAGLGAVAVASSRAAPLAAASKPPAGLQVLTPHEERELNAWCEVLVPGSGAVQLPGSAERGVARFVDHQLAARPTDVLLTIRSDTDIGPPFVDFYRSGLTALDRWSKGAAGQPFSRLDGAQQASLVQRLTAPAPVPGWTGPPQFTWYVITRSDAVDVVFGTPAGFADLGHPYLAHMAPPPTLWVTDRERV